MSRLAQIAEMLVNGPPKTRAADIKTLVVQAVQESIKYLIDNKLIGIPDMLK